MANPLRRCFDSKHRVTKADDMRYRQELADYIGKQSVLFGSEEGFEFGVAQSHYFEGMMSQKTGYQGYPGEETVIPLFELVYSDAIQIYAHQGDPVLPNQPNYILDHILYAEMPVYDFGKHRDWIDLTEQFEPQLGFESSLVFAHGGRRVADACGRRPDHQRKARPCPSAHPDRSYAFPHRQGPASSSRTRRDLRGTHTHEHGHEDMTHIHGHRPDTQHRHAH
jgi:hypothetical protein